MLTYVESSLNILDILLDVLSRTYCYCQMDTNTIHMNEKSIDYMNWITRSCVPCDVNKLFFDYTV